MTQHHKKDGAPENSELHLHGLRVLNTRPLLQGKTLAQAIAHAGGISVSLPLLATAPTASDWLSVLPSLNRVNHAIFCSTNAVNYFFTGLAKNLISWPASINTLAIGNASASALTSRGIRVDYIPFFASSEEMLECPLLQQVSGQNVLLVKGEDGRKVLADTLATRGAHITALSVYRRTLPRLSALKVHALWQDDLVDIILFTSEEAIDNLLAILGDKGMRWLCNKPCLVISHRLAKKTALCGIKTTITCCYDTIINALQGYVANKQANRLRPVDISPDHARIY